MVGIAKGKITMKQASRKIYPFLWFDDKAEEASRFYVSIFSGSKILNTSYYGDSGSVVSGRPEGSVMVVDFLLRGQRFSALNGGPIFKFSPAISFFAYSKTEKEVDELFRKLSDRGEIMMPLGKYPFSERYAFIKDRFGVSWQLMLSPDHELITPCLLFVGKDLGKAEAAIRFYTEVFKDSKIDHILHYGKGENGKEGTVMHSSFMLEGQEFVAMDGTGPHKFGFDESTSFVVSCKSQKEIDYFWDELSKDGEKNQCGWLKDRFGVSWQVVPSIIDELMSSIGKEKSEKVMSEILKMKKLDIKKLKDAAK